MGEIAEMMLEGVMCQCCGEFMDDVLDGPDPFEAPGYPRTCEGCGGGSEQAAPKRQVKREKHTVCKHPGCKKRFHNSYSLAQHMRDKHGEAKVSA